LASSDVSTTVAEYGGGDGGGDGGSGRVLRLGHVFGYLVLSLMFVLLSLSCDYLVRKFVAFV
jgi:hypothetical protein